MRVPSSLDHTLLLRKEAEEPLLTKFSCCCYCRYYCRCYCCFYKTSAYSDILNQRIQVVFFCSPAPPNDSKSTASCKRVVWSSLQPGWWTDGGWVGVTGLRSSGLDHDRQPSCIINPVCCEFVWPCVFRTQRYQPWWQEWLWPGWRSGAGEGRRGKGGSLSSSITAQNKQMEESRRLCQSLDGGKVKGSSSLLGSMLLGPLRIVFQLLTALLNY